MEFRSATNVGQTKKVESTSSNISMHIPDSAKPRVVIVGGGFGGIELIKALKKFDFQIVLLDKHNYHTFQPLLYQVATAGLEPDSIAAPLRRVFNEYKDFYFRMTEVIKIHPDQKCIHTSIGNLKYDYLVLATGSKTNYYGMNEVKENALPMKQIPQALDIRSKLLQNYELALLTEDPKQLNSLLDVVIVGGGPTGVELAGAISELRKSVLPKDLPELDFRQMDISLLEAGPRLLAGMSDYAGKKALKYLQDFNITVKLNTSVKSYDGYHVKLGDGSEIVSQTVIWAAGVTGNLIDGIKPESIKGGRYLADQHNKVVGYEDIFAIGDAAAVITELTPKGDPMLAQVAMQQGKLLAKNLNAIRQNKPLNNFKYHNKGSMATVGRNKAVVDFPKFEIAGMFAWFIWMFVHLFSLIGFRNKIATFLNWVWNYFTYDRATRIIIRPWRKNNIDNKE